MISPQPDPERPIRFGTRGSALALKQTDLAIARFRAVHPDRHVEIRIITTEGDIDKTSPLTEIGGRGVFTNAIESAIIVGEVDAAVHSAKDLPTALHPSAPIVAFPSRDDPRDVLVSRHGTTLDRLPAHPVIGTSSRRRAVQIARLRPDARIVSIRGNLDTRIRKAEGSELDAIVLAAAGLHRMGWSSRISQYFSVQDLVPSPAQGAIAIQALIDSEVAAILQSIDDPAVSTPVRIERAFLAAVGAGCTYPAGAYAAPSAEGYRLIAMLANDAGDRIAMADELLAAGDERAHVADLATRLRAEIGMAPPPRSLHGSIDRIRDLEGARVVVTRPRRQAAPLFSALNERGANPLPLPTIRVEPVADTAKLDAALRNAERGAFDWIVFTSANAVDVFTRRIADLALPSRLLADVRIAAIGPATSAAATGAGLHVHCVPTTATEDALAAKLVKQAPPCSRVLYPRSAIGRDHLPEALRKAGIDVKTVEIYQTRPEPDVDPLVLRQVRRGEIDLITFASPSSIRNFIDLLGEDRIALDSVPVVCVGSVTGQAARDAGLQVVAISDDPGAEAMTDAISAYWRSRNNSVESRGDLVFASSAAGTHERGGE